MYVCSKILTHIFSGIWSLEYFFCLWCLKTIIFGNSTIVRARQREKFDLGSALLKAHEQINEFTSMSTLVPQDPALIIGKVTLDIYLCYYVLVIYFCVTEYLLVI